MSKSAIRIRNAFVVWMIFASAVYAFCQEVPNRIRLDDRLEIEQLSKHVYVHVSYMDIPGFGPFPCNGLVYLNNREVILFDTPFNDSLTALLTDWIRDSLGATIKSVVINHFHNDCLGGLQLIHNLNIPSYAHASCIKLARKSGTTFPQVGFEDKLDLRLGDGLVSCRYFGEAHSPDNIVCWVDSEKILFGGCMVKSLSSGKGNLADANVKKWPQTLEKVKQAYPGVKFVIPGHGNPGGTELLDYTIKLFTE